MASVSFPACGGYGIIRITDSDWYGWNIRGSSDYVDFYTTSGIGTSDVFYEIKPNCSTSSKSASFSLYTDDGYSMGVWSVSIAAKKTGDDQVTVTPTSLAMPLGAPETVSVETEGTWTLCTPIMDDAYAIYRNRCEIKVTGVFIGTEYTGSRDFTVTYQDGNEMYVSRLNVRLACTDQDITVRQADYPTIANKTITVPAEGATIQIGPYNTTSWTASEFPDWIIPSTTGGTAIARFTITVPPNITGGSRTGTFIIKTGGTSYTFTVIQDNLDVSGPGTITFDNAGGSASGTITYEIEPDTITHTVEGDWITLTNGTNAADFNVSVPAVGGIVSRAGNVISTLTFGDRSATIITSIVQEGSNYRFTPATAEIPTEGGSVTIEVESDYPLDGYNSVSSSFGTISFTRVSDTKISIEYTRPYTTSDINDTVVLNGDVGFNSISLTSITQSKIKISPEDITLEVPVGGGTYPIFFDSEGWEMISFPDWVTPSSTSGNGNIEFDLVVKQNLNEEERTGEVIFSTNSVLYTISINQEALEMRITGVISFDNAGGEKNIRIREWNLKPNSFRIEIEDFWKNVYSARYEFTDTEANVYVTAPAIGGRLNILCDLYIYAVYDDGEYLIKEYITQNGRNYVITPDAVAFGSEGGTVTITVTSDYTLSYYTSVESEYGNSTLEIISDTEYRITCVVPPGQETIQFWPKLLSTYKQGSTGINSITLTEISRSLPSGFIGTVPAGKVRLGGILTTFYDSGQRLPTSVARYVVNGEIIEPYIEDPVAPNSTYYGVYYDFDEPTTIDIQLSVNNSALMSLIDGDYLTIQAYGLTGLESLYHLCEDCSQLTSIDLSCITSSSIESIEGIFERCYSLTEIIWPEENIWADVVDCSSSFTGTPIVEWNMPINPGRVREMFYGCSKLKSITINGWKDPLEIDEGYYMFRNCTSLKEIYLNSTFIPVMYVTTQVAEYGTLYVPPEVENLPWRTTPSWTLLFDKYYWNLKTFIPESIWDFPTDPIYFDDNGGSVDINFTSSVEIENIIISNVPDWLTFTRSGNTITCVASQNTSSQPRTATVSFEAEGYNTIKQIVFTQEQVELSITRESYLYVYPADINGYVAKNVPVHITCNIWNTGYTWEISTFKEGYETDCKAVVDHYETSGNVASVYLNLFSLVLEHHNAIINVKIKNGDEIVYEEDVNVKWPYVRSNGNVWHQDFGVSTGIVVNTMPKEREIVYVYYEDEGYGRIFGEYYNGDYQAINATWTSGDIDRTGSQSLYGYEVVQSKTNNYTGVVRDVEGTYTCKNNEYDVTSTVPITVRQVGNEKYTCIAEERIPYNKTCVSFAYGGYMPYTFNIKADNYVKYIQFEDTQNWECYTAVLYGLEPNLTDQDREIRIPYDVMNGTTVVESGEMVIIQKNAFEVSQTEVFVPQQGGEYYIEVSALGDWTIETSGAFFEVEPTSGNGDGGFLIKVYENPYVDMREGVVYVKMANETIEIKITQEGYAPFLYFGKEYIPVRRAGGLVRLMLYSNIRWTTEWVTL